MKKKNKQTNILCGFIRLFFVKRSKIILQRIYTSLRPHVKTLVLLVSADRFKSRNVENYR